MDVKKIGIWAGAFIGSFVVIAVLVYFLFPFLNPEKAEDVVKKQPAVEQASYDPSQYSLEAVDSLNQEISSRQMVLDSLIRNDSLKQQVIDSLQQQLVEMPEQQSMQEMTEASTVEAKDIPKIEEASKPLLKLDEDALAPIVDLLDEDQLITLYSKGSSREREKLLRTLKPQKAARILKKVM